MKRRGSCTVVAAAIVLLAAMAIAIKYGMDRKGDPTEEATHPSHPGEDAVLRSIPMYFGWETLGQMVR